MYPAAVAGTRRGKPLPPAHVAVRLKMNFVSWQRSNCGTLSPAGNWKYLLPVDYVKRMNGIPVSLNLLCKSQQVMSKRLYKQCTSYIWERYVRTSYFDTTAGTISIQCIRKCVSQESLLNLFVCTLKWWVYGSR